jgi:hypothetical protein
MGGEDPIRPDPPGFPVPGGMAVKPRRTLEPNPPLPGGFRHPSRRDGNKPEGYLQRDAELFDPPGISPAFLPGPNPMVHMETKKVKP